MPSALVNKSESLRILYECACACRRLQSESFRIYLFNATCISLMCNLNPYRFYINATCIVLAYNPSPYGLIVNATCINYNPLITLILKRSLKS
jgi:hypothetical protein